MKPTTAHKLFGAGLAAWLLQAWMAVPVRSQPVAGLSQTAIAGQMLFEKRCTGCHGLDTAKEGPPLRTVYGRKAGSAAGFEYSDALKKSQMVWDDAKLNQWLSNTGSLVKGNDMDFAVPKPEERAEIIQYLKESSGK